MLGPEQGCPSEAAHLCGVACKVPAHVGLWLPARSACRPGSSLWAVSHRAGTAHAPPRDSRPTGPAGLAPGLGGLACQKGWGAEAGLGVPTAPPSSPCPQTVGVGSKRLSGGQRSVEVSASPEPPVATGLRSGLVQAHVTGRQVGTISDPPCDRAGDELELIRPSVYRNVARQLNISLQSETVVTDAFLAVSAQIFSAGRPVRPPQDAHHASVARGL